MTLDDLIFKFKYAWWTSTCGKEYEDWKDEHKKA